MLCHQGTWWQLKFVNSLSKWFPSANGWQLTFQSEAELMMYVILWGDTEKYIEHKSDIFTKNSSHTICIVKNGA